MSDIMGKILMGAIDCAISGKDPEEAAKKVAEEIKRDLENENKETTKCRPEGVQKAKSKCKSGTIPRIEPDFDGDAVLIKFKHKKNDEKYEVKIKGAGPLLSAGIKELLKDIALDVTEGDEVRAVRFIDLISKNAIAEILDAKFKGGK